jgi:hypothetical protein
MMAGTFGRAALTFGNISRPLMRGMLMSDRIDTKATLDSSPSTDYETTQLKAI